MDTPISPSTAHSSPVGKIRTQLSPEGVRGGVPEPSTWVMMLLSFAGLGYAVFRRFKQEPRRELSAPPSRTLTGSAFPRTTIRLSYDYSLGRRFVRRNHREAMASIGRILP